MSGTGEERLVKVYNGTLWQAQLVKGLLDANSVDCMIVDETIGAVTSFYASLDGGEVYVVVNEKDEECALELIKKSGYTCTVLNTMCDNSRLYMCIIT